MRQLQFAKLEALGNDFILIENKSKSSNLSVKEIQKLSNRKTGIGFDQLLVLKNAKDVHAEIEFWNADGSKAEMCGNGIRAATFYLYLKAEGEISDFCFKTKAGKLNARVVSAENQSGQVICEMIFPKWQRVPVSFKHSVQKSVLSYVEVGNPHLVSFAYPNSMKQFLKWGSEIEKHKAFPKRTNVEFAQVMDPHGIQVLVWERGVGPTDACGSGAVAVACSAIENQLVTSPVEIVFPGGNVIVYWDGLSKPFLEGDARLVFFGEAYL